MLLNVHNELASGVYPNAAYAYAYDEDGHQKSAKPKPKARGDRDFKAGSRRGAYSSFFSRQDQPPPSAL